MHANFERNVQEPREHVMLKMEAARRQFAMQESIFRLHKARGEEIKIFRQANERKMEQRFVELNN